MSTFAGRTHDVREDARRLVEDLGAVKNTAGKLVFDARQALDAFGIERRVQRNPIGMVAGAAAVGFVLGGGLFRPLAARAVRTGLKLALIPWIRGRILGYVQEIAGVRTGGGPGGRAREERFRGEVPREPRGI